MVLNELFYLSNWYQVNIINNQVVQKYNSLVAKINTNIQPNTQGQPFEDEKLDLINTLKNIEITELSRPQINVFEKFNISDCFGIDSANNIENLFHYHELDLASIKNKLTERINCLNQATNKFKAIKVSISELIDIDETYENENGIIMRIHFDNEVAIQNMADLKKWGTKLELLMRSIAEYNNQRVEDVKVISAEKGSIVYVLKVTIEIAKDLGVAIATILGCMKLYYEVQISQEKLKKLRIDESVNKDIIEKLEGQKKQILSDAAKQVISELTKNLNKQVKGEAESKLDKGISVLTDFIQGGGDIEISTPDVDENDNTDDEEGSESSLDVEKIIEVRNKFKEIKEFQREILLLSNSYDE